MVYDAGAMSEFSFDDIRTGRLSCVLSIGLSVAIGVIGAVGLFVTAADSDSWLHSPWTIAAAIDNLLTYTIAFAALGGLIGLLFRSWLSRRFIIIFWTTVGLFAPALGLLLAITLTLDIRIEIERILPLFAATGAAGFVFGIISARTRTGLTGRSRRMVILGAPIGGMLGLAAMILARAGERLLRDPNIRIHEVGGPSGAIIVVSIVSAILGAAISAALGADRREPVGFPMQVDQSTAEINS